MTKHPTPEQKRANHRNELLAPVKRWTAGRKLELLIGIDARLLTIEEACAAHNISPDELASWRAA